MIKQLKFASIPTSDQDRALTFWTEKVGFQPSIDQARHNLLSMVSTLTRLRGLGEI